MPSENLQEDIQKKQKDDVFSVPWSNSDVVLVVEGKEFHVHRWMLSLQSPVFSAMFNGNFKDSSQEKIELKGDKHEAMLLFLKLLYPPNMLDEEDVGEVSIEDENVLSIVELADKYEAKNVMKQCSNRAEFLRPENTLKLLPYAARHDLPVDDILDVIARHISTDKLENFATELDNSVYVKTLTEKCRVQEDVIKRANTVIQIMVNRHVTDTARKITNKHPMCVRHYYNNAPDFKKARQCRRCLRAYMKCVDAENFYPKDEPSGPTNLAELLSRREAKKIELTELLICTDDIATFLQK